MKKNVIILLCALVSIGYGCLKPVEEFSKPVMTVGYSEQDTIYFSEILTASINVKLECQEDLYGFKMYCNPPRWQIDSFFANYTHNAELNVNFSHTKGHVIESTDSTYKLTFMAFTEHDTIYANRTLKYKFEYPKIDSFDIELSANPSNPCLLDVKNQCAYRYTEYSTHMYDLVLINERRPFYTSVGISGVSLVSPNAVSYLSGYFEDLNPSLPPYEEGALSFKETKIGYVHTTLINNSIKVTAEMIGSEDGWSQTKIQLGDQDLGYAYHDLKRGTLYKCELSDGKYIVFQLTNKANSNSADATVTLRVYYQK